MRMRLIRAIDILVILLSALAGDFFIFGQFGRYWWVFDLFANFQIYYFIWFVVAFVYLLLRKQKIWMVLPLVGLVVTGIMIFSVYVPVKNDFVGTQNIKILFYNMFAYNEQYDAIADYVKEKDPDVIIFAEMLRESHDEMAERLDQYTHTQHEGADTDGGTLAYFAKGGAC